MTKLGPHNRLIVGKLPCSHLACSRGHAVGLALIVEFQSHKWDPGTFINVGACWLWHPKEHDPRWPAHETRSDSYLDRLPNNRLESGVRKSRAAHSEH